MSSFDDDFLAAAVPDFETTFGATARYIPRSGTERIITVWPEGARSQKHGPRSMHDVEEKEIVLGVRTDPEEGIADPFQGDVIEVYSKRWHFMHAGETVGGMRITTWERAAATRSRIPEQRL